MSSTRGRRARAADRRRHRARERSGGGAARHLAARDDARDEQHPPGHHADLHARQSRSGRRRRSSRRSSTAGGARIPWVDVLWLALTIAVTLVLAFTTFGRGIYAVGVEPPRLRALRAARAPNDRARVHGERSRGGARRDPARRLLGPGVPRQGDEYLLPAIAVVVIGGTSIFGGKGSYMQTVAGALLITVIRASSSRADVDQSGQDILYGAIILAMAYLNQVAIAPDERPARAAASGVQGSAPAAAGWRPAARRRPRRRRPPADPRERRTDDERRACRVRDRRGGGHRPRDVRRRSSRPATASRSPISTRGASGRPRPPSSTRRASACVGLACDVCVDGVRRRRRAAALSSASAGSTRS